MRLQVFLSRNGVCSRRRALEMVKEGEVTLNGRVCREPSTPVDPSLDHVAVLNKAVMSKTCDYVLLHKPSGYTTTKSDRFAQKTVLNLLPDRFQHLSPVGRLDRDTEGLLLLTNDGDAAYRLTHPKFNIDKAYFVRVTGELTSAEKKQLENGITLDGKRTAPAKIDHVKFTGGKTELRITIHEGRKRQIRLMFAGVGHRVVYLKRLTQGPLALGALKRGASRELTQKEISLLRSLVDGPAPSAKV